MNSRMTVWRRFVWGAAIAVGVYSCATPAEPLPNNQDDPPPPPPTPTVATVDVAGGSAALSSLGETVQLAATAKDAGGATVSKSFTWLSSDDAVATVSSSGLVTAVGNGTATITASVDGKNGTADVTVSQVAAKLGFTTSPSNADQGQTISPAVIVTALDARDNTATNYSGDVAVALATNPGGASLGGTMSIAASAGVAAFSDLTVDKAASGYTLEASANGLMSSTSGSFDIAGPAPQGAWSAVSAGGLFTCGHRSGVGFCWGTNGDGRLGAGSGGANATVPITLAAIQQVKALDAGDRHGCAVTVPGTVHCWGYNANGQLGDATSTSRTSPVQIVSAKAFIGVSTGTFHSCALTSSGETHCWGSNSQGQFGTGMVGLDLNSSPSLAAGGTRFASVTVGGVFTCWLDVNKAASCVGDNSGGQLGDGTTTDRLTATMAAPAGAGTV